MQPPEMRVLDFVSHISVQFLVVSSVYQRDTTGFHWQKVVPLRKRIQKRCQKGRGDFNKAQSKTMISSDKDLNRVSGMKLFWPWCDAGSHPLRMLTQKRFAPLGLSGDSSLRIRCRKEFGWGSVEPTGRILILPFQLIHARCTALLAQLAQVKFIRLLMLCDLFAPNPSIISNSPRPRRPARRDETMSRNASLEGERIPVTPCSALC